MDAPAGDERMRRLQRVAYGAVASDTERAAALAELEALRREQAHVADRADAVAGAPSSATGDPPAPVVERTPTGSTRAVAEWIAASDAASVRRFRWAVAAGTAALLVGVAVGWQLGSRMTEAQVSSVASNPAPRLQADVLAALPMAADTRAAQVFSRPATAQDVPEIGGQPARDFSLGNGDDPVEFRLLATRTDGVQFFAARQGGDVCLFVPTPAPGAVATCTSDGRFPNGGLQLTGSAGEGLASLDAVWHADGSLQLGLLGLAGS